MYEGLLVAARAQKKISIIIILLCKLAGCVGYLTDVGVGTSLSPSPSSPLLTDEASGYASPFVLQPLPTRSLDASAFFSTVEITSRLLLVSPTPTPAGPIPVFEDPVP